MAQTAGYTHHFILLSPAIRNSSPLYETPSYESPSGDGEGSFNVPAISDARSLTRGGFADECGDAKHAGVFKHLLLESGERGVTVHAFCSKQMTDVEQDTSTESAGGTPLGARNGVRKLRLRYRGIRGPFLQLRDNSPKCNGEARKKEK